MSKRVTVDVAVKGIEELTKAVSQMGVTIRECSSALVSIHSQLNTEVGRVGDILEEKLDNVTGSDFMVSDVFDERVINILEAAFGRPAHSIPLTKVERLGERMLRRQRNCGNFTIISIKETLEKYGRKLGP